MNFSTDRDLLLLEPGVFNDVPFVAQQRMRVNDGVLSAGELSTVNGDFVLAGVDAGSVVLIRGVPHEVVERLDPQSVRVTLPLGEPGRPAIHGPDADGLDVIVRSFEPQAALVHDALLRLLGIDVDDPASPLTEDAVVSLSVMARLEALGTLERIYGSAVALTGDNSTLLARAQSYQRQFGQAVRSARVMIDVNGDGLGDERRDLGLIHLVRS